MKDTYVYIIGAEGRGFKIGNSKSPNIRVKGLQTGNESELSIAFIYKSKNAKLIEKTLHRYYQHKNLRGEWFGLTHDDIQDIKIKCPVIDSNIDCIKGNTTLSKVA